MEESYISEDKNNSFKSPKYVTQWRSIMCHSFLPKDISLQALEHVPQGIILKSSHYATSLLCMALWALGDHFLSQLHDGRREMYPHSK